MWAHGATIYDITEGIGSLAIAVEMALSNDQDQWKLREISNDIIGRFGYLLLV